MTKGSFWLSFLRRNFLLVARYSFKLTRYSLFVAKSLVIRCKTCSLLAAEVARCKKWLVTRCKKSLVICCAIRSLLVGEVARCKKSFVTRCKIHSLLVAEVARCKKSLVSRCKICLLLIAEVASCKKFLVTRYEKNPGTKANKDRWILFIYSLFSVD